MFLTNSDMVELIELRHALHRAPEISGDERETAKSDRRFPRAECTGPHRRRARRPRRRRDL
jgi:hypothetical protein